MLVIVAPGQGAQTPGFLTPWLEDPTFAARFDWLATVAGIDLAHFGTEADADTIRDTKIAQPLLVATGLVAALDLFPHPADAFSRIGAVAGHSVGELTAAAGARVITAEQAMVLVRERGNAMADAAATTATGMTAVLGGDRDEVLAAIERHGLTAANDNGPGQVVAAGTMEQLAAFAEEPPAKARLMPLSVAGAFHTTHMAPAVDRMASLARSVSTHDPRTPVISNRDGQVVHDGRDVLRRIVGQIANPVRWDLCLETMTDLGVTGILEMPPAGTLTGIAKRALKGVETFALKTPDQLDAARDFCDKHGEASMIETTPTWRMVVSPAKGTFHLSSEAVERDLLEPGAVIGAVASLRDRIEITAPHGGSVVEWLVEDGDLVSPGQPLLRLHPEATALMAPIAGHDGCTAHAHHGHGLLPPRPPRPQLRGRRRDRLQRRVDPAALRHQDPPLGRSRGVGPDDVASRRPGSPSSAPGLEVGEIDCVVVATVSHLLQTPAVATAIAHELGTDGAAAFDISAACAGLLPRHLPRPPTWSAPAAPATSWSSGSSGSPTSST